MGSDAQFIQLLDIGCSAFGGVVRDKEKPFALGIKVMKVMTIRKGKLMEREKSLLPLGWWQQINI